MSGLTSYFELSNGVKIPKLGFGTFRTPDGKVCEDSVRKALEVGYRHIDTARGYQNEGSVGRAIRESGVKREDIFVTSKVWNRMRGYEKTKECFEQTMSDLGIGYLDLYLIHWPYNKGTIDEWAKVNAETWKALEELYESGRIKSIGVSNFKRHHLELLEKTANIKPMVNQIEFHIGTLQPLTVAYCKERGIQVEAWSPLGAGLCLKDERLAAIAGKYGKTPAQVTLRWVLQQDLLPLVKSVTPARIEENADIFDFELSAEDVEAISAIPNLGCSGWEPDEVLW